METLLFQKYTIHNSSKVPCLGNSQYAPGNTEGDGDRKRQFALIKQTKESWIEFQSIP